MQRQGLRAVAKKESPCIGVCVLNKSNVCVGCWRTLKEIEDYGKDNNCRLERKKV